MESYKVILFYRYVVIEHTEELREILYDKCQELCLLGRILLANEGINGTLAGKPANIDLFVSFMKLDQRFSMVDWKDSYGNGKLPFPILSVKIVPEIVSCGKRGKELQQTAIYDPSTFGGLGDTGKHLTAEEFHEGLNDPNCIVLDIRNHFEYDIGHFEKAVNIGTYTYAETFDKLDYLLQIPSTNDSAKARNIANTPAEATTITNPTNVTNAHLETGDPDPSLVDNEEKDEAKNSKKIFMYCTGGVRCEKASAYLRTKGLDNVYHLQGGIHRYLQAYPDGGKFAGKNFVFDSRIAMGPDGDNNETSVIATTTAEGAEANNIVGQCIDCSTPFDRYSGKIVCTVCRQPVLVCDLCVTENIHPNEYYCVRHRDLKGIYLTILDNQPLEALRFQRNSLQKLVDISVALANEKKQEKLKQRQKYNRLRHRQESLKHQRPSTEQQSSIDYINFNNDDINNTDNESSGNNNIPIEGEGHHDEDATQQELQLINEGKHRRKTLRKQIERLNDLIRTLETAHKDTMIATEDVLPNPKARVGYGFWNS